MTPNALFLYFKRTDKFHTSERGNVPREVFEPLLGRGDGASQTLTAERLLSANGNRMPGLSSTGSEFRIVVIPNEELDFGWPITLSPSEGSS